jgi:hypothetical protein
MRSPEAKKCHGLNLKLENLIFYQVPAAAIEAKP